MPSLALSDEAIPLAPVRQEEAVEKKKKRAIGKKVGRKAKSSKGGDLGQEQDSLDDREEHQAVKDAEAKSEVLRKQRRELEAKFEYSNRMYINGLYKKELEEEIFKLKEALVIAGANSPKSEELGLP
ncbi:hypothetical protein COCNU_scaffold000313G000030 [Cocos nucifera]|nr:hypothetical protein [Cocos nucifera]